MDILHEKNVQVQGRYTWKNEILYLAYSASYIEVHAVAKRLTAEFITSFYRDKDGIQDIYNGWLAIFVDDMENPVKRIELQKEKASYIIYENIEEKEVTVRIMKFSEAAYAKTGIAKLELDGILLKPHKLPDRKIEFIGDSITAAYGVEGVLEENSFTTADENPLLGYAYKTAKLLNAQFQLIGWSGTGVITNFVEETINEPFLDRWIMPNLYPYSDGELESSFGKKLSEYEIWDNSKYDPNLVVLFIGTNDGSYTRGIKERQDHFRREYNKFLDVIREKNPNAYILCTIGTMRQELWEVEKMVVDQRKEAGDEKIGFLHLPMQEEADGMATDYHPSAITHTKVANMIADYCNQYVYKKDF